MNVRCRFAPAPSGSLHVGSAHTALFSWLTARHLGGAFVLRIEDTDADRVTDEAAEGVLRSLSWLGIDWDEGPDVGGPHGPYRQSERAAIHQDHVDRLIAGGHAYRCYCTPQELDERRKKAMAEGRPPGYDNRCRNLTDAERAAHEAEGRTFAIRFAMPERDIVVQDAIHGSVDFAEGSLPDFVIRRSDGSPTYLLAAAVDDVLMEMTHVIRGDDLMAATPRQIAVVEALGGTPPVYGHVPLILGPDRQKLSKRHGATSVEAFRERGFLPEALMNYLALLGWSKDEHTTFLTRSELVDAFDLARVSHNPAAFDPEKLEWMNGHYLRELDPDDLAARIVPLLAEAGLSVDPELLRAAVPLVIERMKLLAEAVGLLRFLFTDDVEPDGKAAKLLAKAGAEHLRAAAELLDGVDPWTSEGVAGALDTLTERVGLSRTKAWQPVRAAVTGSTVSPPLDGSLHLLGKERSVTRLRAAAARIEEEMP